MPNISRVLVIRPGGIGDAILLMPFLSALKKANPDMALTVLAEKRNRSAFSLSPVPLEAVLSYDIPNELCRAIRSRFDVVIDTEQWHRLSAVVGRLVRSDIKIGFDTNERRRMFTHRIPYRHEQYELESFLDLLRPLIDEPKTPSAPFLTVPPEAAELAQSLVPEGPFVVMFPGASIEERRWGAANFHRLALIIKDFGLKTVVVGGEGDRQAGEATVAGTGGVNLAGRTSLVETAAVIQKAELVISGDSGVLHIGVGLGVPTVSLFGPGIQEKWGPRDENHIIINKRLPCSPCTKFGYTPKCRYQARCMNEIRVDDVAAAASELLMRTRAKKNEIRC